MPPPVSSFQLYEYQLIQPVRAILADLIQGCFDFFPG
jgi:hypothetical protein